MERMSASLWSALALVALSIGVLTEQQSGTQQLSDQAKVTVTVLGRDHKPPPRVPKEAVVVHQGGEVRPVLAWVPAQGKDANLDLAVVVDDSLNTSVALQLADVASFLRALPPTARVAVAYSANGVAQIQQDFTTDHERAAKALRLPRGSSSAYSGTYEALVDLRKRWNSTSDRLAVLLISNGIDLLRGVTDSQPGLNQDLQAAIDDYQRNGIVVYTLYASGAGRTGRNFLLTSNGQSCLARLAAETGGDSYFLGFQTPVSFKPFLDDLAKLLGQQYLLTFRVKPGKNAGVARLKVTAEEPGAVLVAPDRVWIPAARE